jgi:aminoglycoside phosphotransferase (APT) family kinase protein
MSDVDSVPVRPEAALDWDVVMPYVQERLGLHTEDVGVGQFAHGAANLTYLVRLGDTHVVLRRPPFGSIPPGAHDMQREFRVLSRLWRHFEPAPRAYLFCDDHSVMGSDFFLMEYRTGVTIRAELPEPLCRHADVGRRLGEALAESVARLHLLDPAACDLADLGKPEGFVARQIEAWGKRWKVASDGRSVPAMEEVRIRLGRALPRPQRTSLLHNDLHLGNCQFDPDDPDRLKTLFDWDMATLGDPLFDVGNLLAYWRDDTDPPSASTAATGGPLGLPSKTELVERYQALTGVDANDISWYHAFARWKIAILREQLYLRYRTGQGGDPRLSTMGTAVATLADQALALIRER